MKLVLPISQSSKFWGRHNGGIALKELDLRSYRGTHHWRVEQTAESLFFIDIALPDTSSTNLQSLLEMTDRCHQRVRTALEIGSEIKDKERQRQVNVWLYAPDLLAQADFAAPGKQRMFYGTVNPAGLHLITHGLAWDDPIVFQGVLHEVVHFWWADQVGEAPSLLNEGVAVYFEHILGTDAVKGCGTLKNLWQEYACKAKPGFLRRLCRNDVFWTEEAAGEPVYGIGGQLVSFLLDTYGLPNVKRIFLRSYFDDPHLPKHVEDVIGEPLDSIEKKIANF